MAKKKKTVGSLKIHLKKPTKLTFNDLKDWVIWQFPRKIGMGLCGAVFSPEPEEGWYPAVIDLKNKVVQVHGHLEQQFGSPNDAADWVAETLKE
jgi:hypothetical protein